MTKWMALATALLNLTSTASAESGRVEFSVVDSIEMTRLVAPDVGERGDKFSSVQHAPDGRHFFVVTSAGDMESGLNVYRLLVYDTVEVRRVVNGELPTLPAASVLATFASDSEYHGIASPRWSEDGRQIAFLGRDRDRPSQVFLVTVQTGELHQLTRSSDEIKSYSINFSARKLVYCARSFPDWTERNKRGYAVKSEDLNTMVSMDPRSITDVYVPWVSYYVVDFERGEFSKVVTQPKTLEGPISISPSGKWAIIAARVAKIPAAWNQYPTIEQYNKAYGSFVEMGIVSADVNKRWANSSEDGRRNDAISSRFEEEGLYQYALIDLESGDIRPLVDAPIAGSPMQIRKPQWSRDSERVVVSGSWAPIDIFLKRNSMSIQRLPNEPSGAIEITIGETLHLVESTSDTFSAVAGQNAVNLALAPVEVWVAQTMNDPPELVARDRLTGNERTITNFNPRFGRIASGHAQIFEWTDKAGRRFRGGLVLPPGHRADTRYPVVIQTHGFSATEFLVDGPYGVSTAFAARSLAARGMIVLQMDETHPLQARVLNSKPVSMRDENSRFIVAVEGAIDALANAALIDRSRVGLIGWSRTAMYVSHFLTFSKYPIAAATVADGTAGTPFCYEVRYGAPFQSGGMYEFEDENMKGIGVPLWGDGIEKWLERSYFFHLSRVRTPIRYEHLGTWIPCDWDAFVLQKRMNRPVEMIHIPGASHNAIQPWARLTSQGGNVDWFDFWLNEHEDADVLKREQYMRWRSLRKLRDMSAHKTTSLGGMY